MPIPHCNSTLVTASSYQSGNFDITVLLSDGSHHILNHIRVDILLNKLIIYCYNSSADKYLPSEIAKLEDIKYILFTSFHFSNRDKAHTQVFSVKLTSSDNCESMSNSVRLTFDINDDVREYDFVSVKSVIKSILRDINIDRVL